MIDFLIGSYKKDFCNCLCRRAVTSASQHAAAATGPAANYYKGNIEKLHFINNQETEEISLAAHGSFRTTVFQTPQHPGYIDQTSLFQISTAGRQDV